MIKSSLNKTSSLDLKSSELTDEKNYLHSNNKMNETVDELNRTNKSLNDLSKAITISSSKHVIKDLCSYNGICSEDIKSPTEIKDNNNDIKRILIMIRTHSNLIIRFFLHLILFIPIP